MNLSFGEIVLLAILATIVYLAISGKLDTAKLKAAIADLRDDGKLNGSASATVSPTPAATVTPEHLQAVAEIVRAAQPAQAPQTAPAASWRPGDPVESEEAYQAMLATLPASTRAMYPAHWAAPTAAAAVNQSPQLPPNQIVAGGNQAATVLNIPAGGFSCPLTVPEGWVGSCGISVVPTSSDPAGQAALYSMRITAADGSMVVETPARPTAANLRFWDSSALGQYQTKLPPGAYNFMLVTSQPSQVWFQYQ